MIMKVAILIFKDLISPPSDVCPEIWIIELIKGKVINLVK